MPFRILSIDGGGLRGVIPLQILKEIERRTGRPIVESFDLIAGTSTGGILATAINLPDPNDLTTPLYNLSHIEELYSTHGGEIFPIRTNKVSQWYSRVRNVFRPKYSNKGLEKVLGKYFLTYRLKDLMLPIFITTYDVRLYRPLFFSSRFINRTSSGFFRERNILVKDICQATSSAPVYLPTHSFQFVDESGRPYSPTCIDGGVYINNPTLGAVVEVINHRNDPLYNKFTDLSDLYILSLGTGWTEKTINRDQGALWGQLKWVRPVIEIMMQANSQTVDHQLEQIFGTRQQYLRINVNIEPNFSEMTDASEDTRSYLIRKVNADIINNALWLEDIQSFINRAGL